MAKPSKVLWDCFWLTFHCNSHHRDGGHVSCSQSVRMWAGEHHDTVNLVCKIMYIFTNFTWRNLGLWSKKWILTCRCPLFFPFATSYNLPCLLTWVQAPPLALQLAELELSPRGWGARGSTMSCCCVGWLQEMNEYQEDIWTVPILNSNAPGKQAPCFKNRCLVMQCMGIGQYNLQVQYTHLTVILMCIW